MGPVPVFGAWGLPFWGAVMANLRVFAYLWPQAGHARAYASSFFVPRPGTVWVLGHGLRVVAQCFAGTPSLWPGLPEPAPRCRACRFRCVADLPPRSKKTRAAWALVDIDLSNLSSHSAVGPLFKDVLRLCRVFVVRLSLCQWFSLGVRFVLVD